MSRHHSGIYICSADNEVGNPARAEIDLKVLCKFSYLLKKILVHILVSKKTSFPVKLNRKISWILINGHSDKEQIEYCQSMMDAWESVLIKRGDHIAEILTCPTKANLSLSLIISVLSKLSGWPRFLLFAGACCEKYCVTSVSTLFCYKFWLSNNRLQTRRVNQGNFFI